MTDADPDAPRPISSDWLSLRRPADEAARQASQPLLADLQDFLAEIRGTDHTGPVRIFDLGAGTGANQAWLAPQLALSQRWTLIDHDADLLDHTLSAPPVDGVAGTEAVVAGIEDLGQILDADADTADSAVDGPAPDRHRFVTCSALLDLLTPDQLRELCATLAATGTAALFSLSVTGVMDIEPADPLDERLNDAFNRHQNRGDRAGAQAVDLTAGYLADANFTVTTVDTPWELTGDHAQLIHRFLSDRADAVLEEDPTLAGEVDRWLARRSEQAAARSLRVTIGHRDLLALPPRR
ncbi:SAM-dependent methyltransferase [Arthrobacter sp. 147(2020)]|uniref:SAM-dependent methyltransferase n=1 Tax=Arthrobacter sp. 147(2020) TaxID=2735318 RepID=UPI001492BF4B|nr:SAM-dependent methyltransferase [Arthrobacter sp. 147(2020)]NOJ64201.1 SAM-dependent methyltransferase [Arthrobacter sp. 147(2020)]